MTNYQRLQSPAITVGDRLRHRLTMAAWEAKARLFGREHLLTRLDQALSVESDRVLDFWYPAPWASGALGRKLERQVSPTAIEGNWHDWLQLNERKFHVERYFLGTGDWKGLHLPMQKNSILREARELQAAGMDYRKTPAYAGYQKRRREGRAKSRNWLTLDTEERIDAYFEHFVGLFESIRQYGLLRQAQIPRENVFSKKMWRKSNLDIALAIDQDGRFSKLPGGQHRLAVATVLELASIPVRISLVHHLWLRGIMAETGLPPVAALLQGLERLEEGTGCSGLI